MSQPRAAEPAPPAPMVGLEPVGRLGSLAAALERLAPLGLALAALAIGRAFRRVALDDPYVTYRYAENLAGGLGPVYNPGERVLSTTASGYALLLAGLRLLLPWRELPGVSNAVSAACLVLAALAVQRPLERHDLCMVRLAGWSRVSL